MMKCYCFDMVLIRNGKVVISGMLKETFSESPLIEREIPLTWDNINEYYRLFGMAFFGWNLASAHKGKVVYLLDGWGYSTKIKEWKEPCLDLILKITPTDISNRVSINDVLKAKDAANALKFLRERWDLGLDKIVKV